MRATSGMIDRLHRGTRPTAHAKYKEFANRCKGVDLKIHSRGRFISPKMAFQRVILYGRFMETPEEIRRRWRYLRDLLREQLARFEGGAIRMHAAGEDVSGSAILRLKKNILDFDTLIARSKQRNP